MNRIINNMSFESFLIYAILIGIVGLVSLIVERKKCDKYALIAFLIIFLFEMPIGVLMKYLFEYPGGLPISEETLFILMLMGAVAFMTVLYIGFFIKWRRGQLKEKQKKAICFSIGALCFSGALIMVICLLNAR